MHLGLQYIHFGKPYHFRCDIRRTHASFPFVKTEALKTKKKFEKGFGVKGRNEPCTIMYVISFFIFIPIFRNVLEVIAGCRGEDIYELGDQIYKNTMNVFFPNEKIE